MPTYKPSEADDIVWSDDLGWVEKSEHPFYHPEPDKDRYLSEREKREKYLKESNIA